MTPGPAEPSSAAVTDRGSDHPPSEGAADGVILLDSEPAVTESRAIRRAGLPSARTFGIAAAIVAIVGLWLALSGGADEDASGAEVREAQSPSSATTPSEDSTAEAATDATAEIVDDAATSTSGLESDTIAPTIGEGPLLGREVGLYLYITDNDLHRIDLDTGEIISWDVTGVPVIEVDGWLLLGMNEYGGPKRAVRAADPTGDAVELPLAQSWPGAVYPSDLPGHIWATRDGPDGPSTVLVELATGEIVEERPANFYAFPAASPLIVAPDGAIWVSDGLTERKVADGGFVAGNDEYVLVTECDGPTDCELAWLDLRTGGQVDRHIPPIDPFQFGGQLSPGGRILTYWAFDGPGFFDVVRGQPIVVSESMWDRGGLVPTSPDERYVVTAIGSTIQISDLDTGDTYEIEARGYSGAAVFAEKG